MANLVGTGLNQVPSNSMLGGLAYQSPDNATIRNLDLKNISQINAQTGDNAVDVFVYDTSKDSDGGAWRKRTSHTSWYNETLNTTTRGSRRDFPAVAVIVTTSTSGMTIYDADDPDMPMWMVFENKTTPSYSMYSGLNGNGVCALNGRIACTGGNFPRVFDFIQDFAWLWDTAGRYSFNTQNLSFRNGYSVNGSTPTLDNRGIVNTTTNDVAMTVLPNAPIDPATGLPVPTIAVATNGGISVIRDDGIVINSGDTAAIRYIHITNEYRLYYTFTSFNQTREVSLPTSWTSSGFAGNYQLLTNSSPALTSNAGTSIKTSKESYGTADGIVFHNPDPVNFPSNAIANNGMVAYATTTYNTGWMHGDIKGAFLSGISTASVTGTALLTGQASTYDVNTTNGGWISQASASNAYNATNGVGGSGCIRLTSTGGSNVWNSLSLGTVTSGAKYSISFSAKIASSAATSFTVSQNQDNVGSYGSLAPTVTTSHVTYSFIFTASSTTAWFNVFAGQGTGSALDIDNIDVRLLAEPDRSVNNNGLTVFGTVTKTAVATGADLVGYSGFSISNYLLQPYNSAIAFGTADFSYMGWAKATTAGGYLFQWDNPNSVSGIRISMFNSTTVRVTVTSVVDRDITYSALTGTWNFFVVQRVGSIIYTYINGVQIDSFSNTTNLSGTDKVLTFGYNGNSTLNLALWRVSATAPSPDQIKKIYNDEKALFQENSKATLYGTSSAVTALAYDDVTKRLHVGTSSGRSEFQGLERINNTTTAVTTAISVYDTFVVEQ